MFYGFLLIVDCSRDIMLVPGLLYRKGGVEAQTFNIVLRPSIDGEDGYTNAANSKLAVSSVWRLL